MKHRRLDTSTIILTALLLIAFAIMPQIARAAHCSDDRPLVPPSVTVKHTKADLHQRRMITRVLNTARQYPAAKRNQRILVAAIVTITQESTARNLRYGHGTSLGLFQIIDIHGTRAQRLSPEWSTRWFTPRAINIAKHHPHYGPARIAQAVQRSAYPSAYAQWQREGYRTLRLYRGTCLRSAHDRPTL